MIQRPLSNLSVPSLTKRRKKAIGSFVCPFPLDSQRNDGYRGFKALKQSTKLLFLTLHRPSDALQTYMQLLTYTKSAVTRNYSEKTINGILDYVGGGKTGKSVTVDVDVLEKFYEATKAALEDAKNEVSGCLRFMRWICLTLFYISQRLSVKTNLKLAKLWLDRKEYGRLSKVPSSSRVIQVKISNDLSATPRSS